MRWTRDQIIGICSLSIAAFMAMFVIITYKVSTYPVPEQYPAIVNQYLPADTSISGHLKRVERNLDSIVAILKNTPQVNDSLANKQTVEISVPRTSNDFQTTDHEEKVVLSLPEHPFEKVRPDEDSSKKFQKPLNSNSFLKRSSVPSKPTKTPRDANYGFAVFQSSLCNGNWSPFVGKFPKHIEDVPPDVRVPASTKRKGKICIYNQRVVADSNLDYFFAFFPDDKNQSIRVYYGVTKVGVNDSNIIDFDKLSYTACHYAASSD